MPALTCTDHASILLMAADVGFPAAVGTQTQLPLAAPACQLTEPHGPCALSKEGTPRGGQRPPTAQLPAGHGGVAQVPAVIAHGAPVPAMPHFHTAGAAVGTVSQAQPLWVRRERP